MNDLEVAYPAEPPPASPDQVAEELLRKDQIYHLLSESRTDILWSSDMDLRWTYISPSIQRVLGFTPAEGMAMPVRESMTPASADLVERTLDRILAQTAEGAATPEESRTLELELVHKNQGTVWAEVRFTILRDGQGAPVGLMGVARDISGRKQVERSLYWSEHRYRALAEATTDWIWEVDAACVFRSVSPKIREMLGYEPEEIVGKTPFDLMPKEEADRVARIFEEIAARRGKLISLENTVVTKSGQRRVVETNGIPMFDAAGRFQGYYGYDRDVTDRKLVADELRIAKEAAEAATRTKSEFLANMSHEIRTPMTAILGFADLLAGSLRNPEDVEAISTIKRNGLYLMDIINDILDLSKIEAGRMVLDRTPCSPVKVVAEILALMRVRAAAKHLALDVLWVGPVPATIQSDPRRLRQILINLVGNAVKFTNAGSVRITGRFLANEAGQAQLQFDIADTGIGMSAEQMRKLFVPFTQGDSSTNRCFGGTGLGLAISKRLAEMLGGDIAVSSRLGAGSTFTLTIDAGPIQALRMLQHPEDVQSTEPRAEPIAARSVRLQGRLLLAEDGHDNQRLIARLLTAAGAEVCSAENGQIAVERVLAADRQSRPFDVILMDMQMPVLDGYEATRQLRACGVTAPIIALTAHAMNGDREKCLEAGCNDYVPKPIDRTSLLAAVSRHIGVPPAADTNS